MAQHSKAFSGGSLYSGGNLYFYPVNVKMPSTKQPPNAAKKGEAHSANHRNLALMAKAAGLFLFAMLFSKIASYAFRWVGAKLGTTEYGYFAMAFGVFEMAVGLGLLGVDSAVGRFIVDESVSRKKSGLAANSFWYGIRVVLVSGTVLAIGLALSSAWIATNVLHAPSMWPSLVLFALAIPFFLLVLVFVASARGLKHVEYEAGAKSILESGLRPLIAFGAIGVGLGVLGLTVSVFASAIIVFMTCAFWSRKLFSQPWFESILSAKRPKGFFKFSLPLYASNLLALVISNAALFSLGLMVSASEAGVFSAVMPLAVFVSTPALGILSIFISVGSELFALGKKSESEKLYKSLSKAILLATLPLCVILAFFSREALTFLYVIDYSQGALALSILSIGYLLYSVFTPAVNYLHVIKRTDLFLFNLFISAILVLVSIFLFVPAYGTAGAAVAFAIGTVAQGILAALEVRKFASIQPFSGSFARTLLAGILSLIPLYFLNGAYGLRGFSRVAFGAFLYCAAYAVLLFILRAFDRDDIELLKAVERKSGFKLGVFRGILKKLYFGKNS